MNRGSRLGLLGFVCALVGALGCGGGGASGGTTPEPAGPPRPGGAVDLLTLIPANANVALRADLSTVRREPARYDQIASELVTELGLGAEAGAVRALLDRTDQALGVFASGAGASQEGMLIFSGNYAASDFGRALEIAGSRHGSTPAPQAGVGGSEIYAMGDATIAKLDQWTWAIATGPGMRAHLSQLVLQGAPRFEHELIEFGPRIGLPLGSSQAWANQDEQAGVDMVALVFAGNNPQMVRNFVVTVSRHLGF